MLKNFVFYCILTSLCITSSYAGSPRRGIYTDAYYNRVRSGLNNTWNPNYGYSTFRNPYGGYGNSAPFQGNFMFAPGFGYGSIYGNYGHPGFNRYTGPAWSYPQAW